MRQVTSSGLIFWLSVIFFFLFVDGVEMDAPSTTIVQSGDGLVMRYTFNTAVIPKSCTSGFCCNDTHCCNWVKIFNQNEMFCEQIANVNIELHSHADSLIDCVSKFSPIMPSCDVSILYNNANKRVLFLDASYTAHVSITSESNRMIYFDWVYPSLIIKLPTSPTNVQYSVSEAGYTTVIWSPPAIGNIPVNLFRVESFPGTTSVCLALGTASNCTYDNKFIGGRHRFVVTALTLVGSSPTSQPSVAVPIAPSLPLVLVKETEVVVSWQLVRDSISPLQPGSEFVVSTEPPVHLPCLKNSKIDDLWQVCSFPISAFDPSKTYQFQITAVYSSGARSLSALSAPSTLNQPTMKLEVGAIVGIAIGCTLFVACAVVAIYLLHRRWTSGAFHRDLEDQDSTLQYYKF